ncbi:MAG TPA: riboflavin synthase [Steroidobacteraceae bacterium]|nr:riboflavin synthase [Steroidobacteraceae bacterium]
MFTGIVHSIGRVAGVTPRGSDVEMAIEAQELDRNRLQVGDSVAVQGVCLTVTRATASGFCADVSHETLGCTTLGRLSTGSRINLEPALRAGDALGGHLVSGHVDGVGKLIARRADGRSSRLEFELPAALARYVAPKGSICIDGVSLTVNEVEGARFGVNLIPHTLAVTTHGALETGDSVNIEVDQLARYLDRLAQFKS